MKVSKKKQVLGGTKPSDFLPGNTRFINGKKSSGLYKFPSVFQGLWKGFRRK